jgi:hypothetical protein
MSASIPLAGTQNGSMFSDRDDPSVSWYLPAFVPADPSQAFAFAASEGTEVGSSGEPLAAATVTIAVTPADPPDVASARAAAPERVYRPIAPSTYDASLALPYKDEQGADQTARVAGQVAAQADGSLVITFSGLLGSRVIQAYEELANVGGASVEVGLTYALYELFTVPVRRPPVFGPIRVPPQRLRAAETGLPAAAPLLPVVSIAPTLPGPIASRPSPLPPLPIHVGPPWQIIPTPLPPEGIWIARSARTVRPAEVGTVYTTGNYRPRYTIKPRSGPTRAIIDVSDLRDFKAARSEFRELTSLGEVKTRYPSLERLYLGQVSGTVVIVPAAYGIVASRGGCAARVDAVVDTSPSTVSGCRFQLTFELAPILDPVDVAQLVEDLKTTPEASSLTLAPTVATTVDHRVSPTFSSEVTNLVFADAADGSGMLMSFEVTDAGSIPALVAVNLLLAQLTSSSTTALFGTIGVRLDDVYEPPVQATFVVNLHSTCATDDVSVTYGEPAGVAITNQSPNDVRLLRMRTTTAQQATVNTLGEALPAGQRAEVAVTDPQKITSAVVQRTLAVPDPFPRSALASYLEVHAETALTAKHTLTVNATAIDFAAHEITELVIQITLDKLPTTSVQSLVLTPEHRVEEARVTVPIDADLTLSATLTISVHTPGATHDRQVQASNDFAAYPIFVLVPAALVASQSWAMASTAQTSNAH